MDVNDYLIDHTTLDWSAMIVDWEWILDDGVEFQPWIMNRFGDIFWVDGDGAVYLLNVSEGTSDRIAENEDEFFDLISEEENAVEWLLMDVVDELVDSGKTLGPGECYAFKELPILGGEYDLDNIYVSSIPSYWRFCGKVHEQIVDLPDGAEVDIDFPDRD